MKNLLTRFSMLLLIISALFACSQSEKVKPEDPRLPRIAAINKEIALGKKAGGRVTANDPTWTVFQGQVGIWGDYTGTGTFENTVIRVDLQNNAGHGLEVQMVYNGSDNGQLIFQDWTNIGMNSTSNYFEPNGSSGGWRDIYFNIPDRYFTNTSDVWVTLRWRSFTSTTTSDWVYFTRHWYHGNKGY